MVRKIRRRSIVKKALKGSFQDFLPIGYKRKARIKKNERMVDRNMRTSIAPNVPLKRRMMTMESIKVPMKKVRRRWGEKPLCLRNHRIAFSSESSLIRFQSIPFRSSRLFKKWYSLFRFIYFCFMRNKVYLATPTSL